MAIFPALNANGLYTQLPYGVSQAFLTSTEAQANGRRYASAQRTEPLRRFSVTYSQLTDAEASVLEAFFDQMKGRYGQFGWLDPAGNLVRYSEDFGHGTWVKQNVTSGAAVADPFGGMRATALAFSGLGVLKTDLEPVGLAGYTLCASAWLKATSGGQTCDIGITDESTYYSKTFAIPEAWTRVWFPRKITGSGTVTWAISCPGGGLQICSPQMTPTPGPGPYVRSPAMYGYRPKCFFGTDTLAVRVLGPNQRSAGFTVEEWG